MKGVQMSTNEWPDSKWIPEVIIDGLWRLRTPMTSDALPWVFAYLFRTPDGLALFDSGHGTPKAQEALRTQVEGLGFSMEDIHSLMISHAHPDHLGMAGWIKELAPDCKIMMIDIEADWYSDNGRGGENWVQQNNLWMIRHGVSESEILAAGEGFSKKTGVADSGDRDRSWFSSKISPDLLLKDNDSIEIGDWSLQAVWTPGHTPGHLCVYIQDHDLILTGDHVLGRITPNVSMSPDDEHSGRDPLTEFLGSLGKIGEYTTSVGLPAHEKLIPKLSDRCSELIQHHANRCAEVMSGIGSSKRASASDISSRVTWNKPFEGFSIFKKRMALGETLAHLHYLEGRGEVKSHGDQSTAITWSLA